MKEIIQKLAKTADEIYAKIGEVVSVDKDNLTVDVQPLDGSALIDDAYLQADSDNGGMLQIPKVGSLVCVVFINKETAIIANTGEIDAFTIKIKNTSFEISPDKAVLKKDNTILEMDQDGFLFKKENETLKKLMADLIKACKQLKFTTNNGPTISLINIQDFIAVETRFNQFLK
ncbi:MULTISPECIES: hypothetical protein [Flavobacterium]|uniref:Uncharacterized protein n=2 Tax=Flavobacterium columnare TaxID=996 RepID=A0AA94F2B8_9FLAO|nr:MULTISPECIES: hypothetical protein [Flavobacterium]MCH4829780.1 hypothetical protein [Flavobacterium columnare]MCH4831241.1 hypothetical protein [Flavobacterium columnare]MCH4831577.1 hypothetical protein [Flavobacterium columnare]MCH4832919.1 hypothetical protein [Flavobacterium columnare]QYS90727.1 hypothetical protein JJC04_12165 [Flavobacterium covae]